MKHLDQDQLTLLYFGEAGGEAKRHAADCPVCQAEYAALANFLDAMHAVPVPERGGEFEGRLWATIRPRVEEALARRPLAFFRYWMVAPALAGLLAVAFIAGMYTQHRTEKSSERAFSSRARERVLMIAMGDHMDRSQIVLAEIVNAPEGKGADLSAEQQLASSLVGENRLLRQTAMRSGDQASAAVLEDLERVLIEIAHSPSEVSPEEMENLRQRIEAQGLLFKVRVIGSNVREKGMKL